MYAAVDKGKANLEGLLLTHQADPDAGLFGVYSHETPLHLAVSKGNIDVIKLLISHNADVNFITRSRHGETRTALHLAIEMGNTNLIKLLLEHIIHISSKMLTGVKLL